MKRDSKGNIDTKKIITAFCCENSGYIAAETISENSLMKSVNIIKVPCAGRVEIGEILKCFEKGIRKVLVLACPIDNCKYIKGNNRAIKRVNSVKNALKDVGLKEDMIRMEFISSLDAQKLIEILKEVKE